MFLLWAKIHKIFMFLMQSSAYIKDWFILLCITSTDLYICKSIMKKAFLYHFVFLCLIFELNFFVRIDVTDKFIDFFNFRGKCVLHVFMKNWKNIVDVMFKMGFEFKWIFWDKGILKFSCAQIGCFKNSNLPRFFKCSWKILFCSRFNVNYK